MRLKEIGNREIILFGAGEWGRTCSSILSELEYKISYFVDNRGYGERMNYGVQVRHPDMLLHVDKTKVFIIITLRNYNMAVKYQLENMGFIEGENYIFCSLLEELKQRIIIQETKKCMNNYCIDDIYYPNMIVMDISSYCNARCIFCSRHGNVNKKPDFIVDHNMDSNTFQYLIDRINEAGCIKRVQNVMNGELLCHPNWIQYLIKLAKETDIHTFYFSSNGMLLSKENVDALLDIPFKDLQISVSIDGETLRENDEIRKGTSYEVIRRNLKYLVSKRPNIPIRIQNCHPITKNFKKENSYNLQEAMCIPAFLKEDFGDANIMSGPILGDEDQILPTNIHLEEAERYTNKFCDRLFCSLGVNSAGEYITCGCGPYNADHIGGVKHDKILDVFNNENFREARNSLLNGRYPDMCNNCSKTWERTCKVWVYE